MQKRALPACLAISLVANLALSQERLPKFTKGSDKWFIEKVEPETVKEETSYCEDHFPGSLTELTSEYQTKIMCLIRNHRTLTVLELEKAKALFEAQTQILPSDRKKPYAIWEESIEPYDCSPGMRKNLIIDPSPKCQKSALTMSSIPDDWARCSARVTFLCKAIVENDEFCKGGIISLPTRTCTRPTCPDGYTSLTLETKNKVGGCYRCPPPGQLDLEETIQAIGLNVKSVLEHGLGYDYELDANKKMRAMLKHFTGVLCKESSPSKAKKPHK